MQEFLTEKLNNGLSKEFLSVIKTVSENAEKLGVKAYIVGGIVRDLLLLKPVFDLDIVIEGNAIEFAKFMEKNRACKIYRTAEDFGTAKVVFEENTEIDIASTRTETYPRAGHLPMVSKIGCSLEEDISRRDFTVNALALSLNKENFGELIDFTGGLLDLEKKELKILHEKSFIDDPTRIIRGLRFRHKLGFSLEKKTENLQQKYLESFNADNICYERIKQVLKLAFNLNFADLYNDFVSENIYKLITKTKPEKNGTSIAKTINANLNHINMQNIWLIYLALSVSTQESEKLNLTAKEKTVIEETEILRQNHQKLITDFEVHSYFKNRIPESVIAYIAKTSNIKARHYLNELKNIKLLISGEDLINLGFSQGKNLGETLNKILEAKINGNIKTKDEEIALAKNILCGF